MALKRDATYPGRFVASSTDHPQGAFKNRTSPTAQDGSYLEAQWANDWDGFFARVLNVAGVAPNGTADTGSASQLYDALLTAMPGRLINIQRFTTNGTYTPTPGTNSIEVEVQGAGAGGGGIGAAGASTVAVGNGGSGGGYLKSRFTSGFSGGIPITVGIGGAGGNLAPTNGINGGVSMFGSLMTAGGGQGGIAQPQTAPPFSVTGSAGGSGGSVGNILAVNGMSSAHGFALNTTSVSSGQGGGSQLGAGGFSPANNGGSPNNASGYGGGGGGSYAFNRSGFSGGSGSDGVVIIREYS